MSMRYTSSFPSTTPAQNQAAFGIVGAAARSAQVKEFCMAGLASSSAPNEIRLNRNTSTFTLTNAITPRPVNITNTVASLLTAGWPSTAITLGTDMLRFGVNGNGALFRWVAPPGSEIELAGNATVQQLGWVNVQSSPSPMSGYVIDDEI